MKRPPSIRDIARVCGYGKSTVAAALTNSAEIPTATAALIRAEAQRLGYRRDPLVADLAARRWRTRPNAAKPLLAFVYDFAGEHVRGGPPLKEVRAAADDFGYRVDAVDLRDFPSDARASRALHTRGYRGLIVGRILRRDRPLELEWERFTAVASDLGFVRPPLHLVMQDRFKAAFLATTTALARGYRRPGYVHLVHNLRESPDPARLGGYVAGCLTVPGCVPLPVHAGLFLENRNTGILGWLREQRPDVVIGFNPLVLWWLTAGGVKVPEDLGFVALEGAVEGDTDVTRLELESKTVQRTAVEFLVGQIHINARGIPSPLQTVLIDPVWHEGTTLVPEQAGSPTDRGN